MRWFKPKAQLKDEHPNAYESYSREIYGACEKCAALKEGGADVEVFYEKERGHNCTFPLGRSGFQAGGQSNVSLLRLIKSIEGRISEPPQGGDASIPVSRVDHRLIGEDQR